jgi:hypothetical protein
VLYGAAARHGEAGLQEMKFLHSGGQQLECPFHLSDLIVRVRRSIQRDDYIVYVLHDLAGELCQQQAGAQNRCADARFPQQAA